MKTFIHIKSDKFPILEGEKEEIVNPGMYGKALSMYLQEKLIKLGYDAPFYCPEDWGWWLGINSPVINFGVCIYAHSTVDEVKEYVCCPSINGVKKWSWSRFRFVNTKELTSKVVSDFVEIFKNDPEVQIVEVTEEFPF